MSTTNDGYPLATDDVPVYSRNAMRALTAEVEHWKAHAQEAGDGFSRVCLDYARVAARNSALCREIERLGGLVPPYPPADHEPAPEAGASGRGA